MPKQSTKKKRIMLPNGCWIGEPCVSPPNWNQAGASTKKDWYIKYYFHDTSLAAGHEHYYGKSCIIKAGMNYFSNLDERRESVRQLIKFEIEKLREGYNPITHTVFVPPTDFDYEINPNTLFLIALKKAFDKLKLQPETINDLDNVLTNFGKAATLLKYDKVKIADVKRRHIKQILGYIQTTNTKFSAHMYNKYRAYLMMLYKVLIEFETLEENPVANISKQKTETKIRQTLTPEERKQVNEFLHQKYYTFWRFIQIFFHSGGRIKELLSVKVSDVNLQNQSYKVMLRKGGKTKQVLKVIKDIALPFWAELMDEAVIGSDYIFSMELRPGAIQIKRNSVTRRWEQHVKEKLKITADLYSLKHSNSTEVADALDAKEAAKLNSHTSTAMVEQVYDVNHQARKDNSLKSIQNHF